MNGLSVVGTTNLKTIFVPFDLSKTDKSKRMVWGYASTEARDSDGESILKTATEGALADYMRFANIREMHQLVAAGIAKTAEMDDKGLYIGAKIVDAAAWEKVQEGVYKGFSIGGKATARDPKDPTIITGLELIEISLVDRPSNPEAMIECYKAGKSLNILGLAKEPTQCWDCGNPGHRHLVKRDAGDCMAAQDKEAVKLQKALLDAIGTLSLEGLQAAVDQVNKKETPLLVVERFDIEATEEEKLAQKARMAEALLEEEPKVELSLAEIIKDRNTIAAGLNIAAGQDPDVSYAFAARLALCDVSQCSTLKSVQNLIGAPDNLFGNSVKLLQAAYQSAKLTLPPDLERVVKMVGGMVPKMPLTTKKEAAEPPPKKKPVVFVDEPVEKKGDYGTHEEAGYADQGLQKDAKPRLPLLKDGKLDAQRIRGAWAYLQKNAGLYTLAQKNAITTAITAAWKEAVDKNGPPSSDGGKVSKSPTTENTEVNKELLKTLGAPDAKDSLEKGLSTVAAVISLLQQLDYITECLEEEAAIEGDHSDMPARFESVVSNMATLAQALLEEELDEMLEDREPHDAMQMKLACALVKRFGTGKRVAEVITKMLSDKTGSPAFEVLTKAAEALEKAGPAQTQEWGGQRRGDENQMNDKWPAELVKKAQDIHDHALEMGAVCKGASSEKTKKKDDKDSSGKEKKDPPPPPKGKDKKDPPDDEEDDEKDDEKDKGKKDNEKDKGKKAKKPPAEEDDDEEEDKGKKSKKAAEVDLSPVLGVLKSLQDQVTSLTSQVRNPARPEKGSFRTVDKGAAFVPAGTGAAPQVGDSADLAKAKREALDNVFNNPQVVNRFIGEQG